MDITPLVPKDKLIIKGYGEALFKINNNEYHNNIILLPDSVSQWDIKEISSISVEKLNIDFNNIEVLLIGTGESHLQLPQEFMYKISQLGVGVEVMSTGAACRTYNVLLTEDRKVAAALIAIRL